MSAASVAGQQVISTAPASSPMGGITNNAVALWVAAYMLIGLLGLFAVGWIFRKHVEI